MWCPCDDPVQAAKQGQSDSNAAEYIAFLEARLLRADDRAKSAEDQLKTYQAKLKRLEAASRPGVAKAAPPSNKDPGARGTKSEREERQDLCVNFLESTVESLELRVKEQAQDLARHEARLRDGARPKASGAPPSEAEERQELVIGFMEETVDRLEGQVKSLRQEKAEGDLKILELQGQLTSAQPQGSVGGGADPAEQLRQREALVDFFEGALDRAEQNHAELETTLRELETERAGWHTKDADRSLSVEGQGLVIHFLEGTVDRLEAQLQVMHEENTALQSLRGKWLNTANSSPAD